ncbi:MAG: copper ion binding protein [Candidatus Vecturithrix sp.]|jgi:Cu+-exporting ATPase|nr:copper ion binding protein [Candidatus Vecturithrix sp.]
MTTTETKRTALKIRGMTCAMCSKTIEQALTDLDGVVLAEVNLGNETAAIEYDPEKVTLTDLEKSVQEAGYEVNHDVASIKIGGMTCAMCTKAIEQSLGELEGVRTVEVNLGTEKASVTYNRALVSLTDM